MTNTSPRTSTEAEDADRVTEGYEAITRKDFTRAEQLLLSVIANTPPDYSNATEYEDEIWIKFWTRENFMHYVTWVQQAHTHNKSITWIGNAYPRAHFYLGMICIEQGQPDKAIQYLEKGMALEPTNPMFYTEKAMALKALGRYEEALAMYDKVSGIDPYTSPLDVAMALRGRGVTLIDMGRLDEAERAFTSSLELAPGNKNALMELEYIRHLRRGGAAAPVKNVITNSVSPDAEYHDAQNVEQAMLALFRGDLDTAENLLLPVIENTPNDYWNEYLGENEVWIKFWRKEDCEQWTEWVRENAGREVKVNWLPNAYPRAHYFMGSVCAERDQFGKALEYLEKGLALQSSSPLFNLEMARIYRLARHYDKALEMYGAISKIGPYTSKSDVARALRGRGATLVDMGRFDEAEVALNASFEFEPGNEIALKGLAFVAQQRGGR